MCIQRNVRRSEMDALRAVAMLLGIAFHTGLAYNGGFWYINDIQSHWLFKWFCSASHGFRMPLFFTISGFFTAMMFKKRGIKQLLIHRFKRILLPCILAVFIFGTLNTLVVRHAMKSESIRQQEQAKHIGEQGAHSDKAFSLANPAEMNDNEWLSTYYDFLSQPLFSKPFFSHLWFLWFLCLLIIIFSFLTYIWSKSKLQIHRSLSSRVVCLFAMLPFVYFAQSMMHYGSVSFGPDTSLGLIPYPHTFLYYGIFFGFGVLFFIRESKTPIKTWRTCIIILLCISSVLPIQGIHETSRNLSNLLQAMYTCVMVFSLIDLFKIYFTRESKYMRYVSDSSYWLYIAHLPTVFLFQHLFRHWEISIFLKFIIT